MKFKLQILILSLAFCLGFSSVEASPSQSRLDVALEWLKHFDSNGWWVYQNGNRETFNFFLSGNQPNPPEVDDVSDAIHEEVHSMTQIGSFPMIGGTFLPFEMIDGPFRNLAKTRLTPEELKDTYTQTYLDSKNGAQSFFSLLGELNAYAHGENTSVILADAFHRKTTLNVGLIRIMRFTSLYLNALRKKDRNVWSLYQGSSSAKNGIYRLWIQAEKVLAAACKSNDMIVDRAAIRQTYSEVSSLEQIFEESVSVKPPQECNTHSE